MIILAAAALAADLSLLRPVTSEGYRAEPFDAPYLAVFDDGRKRLIFVSGDHGHGKDSAVARTIHRAMNEHKPGVVVIEGVSPDHIDSIQRSALGELRDSPKTISEAMYSAALAGRAGIPVITGELRDRDEFEFVRKAGYTIEDYVFYYMAASIPSWLADGRRIDPRFRRDAARTMGANAREAGVNRSFTYEDFERWYRTRVRLDKAPQELTYNDSGPVSGPSANHLQRIGAARDRPREEAIIHVIERMLNRHDRVLVVYGSGHLVKQRKVWEALLGPSRDSKPY